MHLSFRKHIRPMFTIRNCVISRVHFFVRLYVPISADFAVVLERLEIFKSICILIDSPGYFPFEKYSSFCIMKQFACTRAQFSNYAIISSLICYQICRLFCIKCSLHFMPIRARQHVCTCREIGFRAIRSLSLLDFGLPSTSQVSYLVDADKLSFLVNISIILRLGPELLGI